MNNSCIICLCSVAACANNIIFGCIFCVFIFYCLWWWSGIWYIINDFCILNHYLILIWNLFLALSVGIHCNRIDLCGLFLSCSLVCQYVFWSNITLFIVLLAWFISTNYFWGRIFNIFNILSLDNWLIFLICLAIYDILDIFCLNYIFCFINFFIW